MTTSNADVPRGISNGSQFLLAKIIFEDESQIHYPREGQKLIPWTFASNIRCLVLKHVNSPFKDLTMIPGLRGFVTLSPRTHHIKSFEWSSRVVDVTGKCTTFPTVAAFSLTGHKTQGQTLKNILIGSFKGHSNGRTGWLYVVISRVKSLENIFIVDKLPENTSWFKLREDVDAEDKRIMKLAIKTSKKFRLHWKKFQKLMDGFE